MSRCGFLWHLSGKWRKTIAETGLIEQDNDASYVYKGENARRLDDAAAIVLYCSRWVDESERRKKNKIRARERVWLVIGLQSGSPSGLAKWPGQIAPCLREYLYYPTTIDLLLHVSSGIFIPSTTQLLIATTLLVYLHDLISDTFTFLRPIIHQIKIIWYIFLLNIFIIKFIYSLLFFSSYFYQ